MIELAAHDVRPVPTVQRASVRGSKAAGAMALPAIVVKTTRPKTNYIISFAVNITF